MKFIDRVKVSAGLIKNGHVKSALDFIINPSNYIGGSAGISGGMWMFSDNASTERLFTYVDKKSSLNAYILCPPVSAIINKKAQAFINGKTSITNVGGKANGKQSNNAEAIKIRKLLNKPNQLQSGKQFEAQMYSLINLYGYCVILALKPFGYDNSDASSLWILPNWFLDVFVSNQAFYEKDAKSIAKINFTYGGQIIELPLESLIIIKDFTPCLVTPALPSNKIQPLEKPINNVIGAYESRGIMIDKRGPTGVFTQEVNPMGNIPFTPKEVDAMEQDFKRYGLRKGQIAVILGNAALKYQKVGFDVNELGLYTEVKESGIAICNGLSFPPFLLGLSDTTYNNQKEASRGLYQEIIIPDSESIYQQLNTAFKTDEYGIEINKDYSHVAALQEDRQLSAAARDLNDKSFEREFKNNVITLNMWLTGLDYDPRTDGFGDKYYHELLSIGWQFGNTTLTGGDNAQVGGVVNTIN